MSDLTADQLTCDHDWKHVSDWIGDPGVINGTMSIYYKECRICGEQEDWDGAQPEDDPDRAYEQARDDAPHWAQFAEQCDD